METGSALGLTQCLSHPGGKGAALLNPGRFPLNPGWCSWNPVPQLGSPWHTLTGIRCVTTAVYYLPELCTLMFIAYLIIHTCQRSMQDIHRAQWDCLSERFDFMLQGIIVFVKCRNFILNVWLNLLYITLHCIVLYYRHLADALIQGNVQKTAKLWPGTGAMYMWKYQFLSVWPS